MAGNSPTTVDAGRIRLALLCLLLVGLCGRPILAQETPQGPPPPDPASRNSSQDPEGILNLDIDQLAKVDVVAPSMTTEVTSVDRQESTVGRSAAAVYVVTQEMIHRSGAHNIPDVLRLVPGLHVAQVDSYTWAVGSRGFNGTYSDKLLVLIDGRSVYSPLFAGVYWDVQDMMLEDIERIEVIRGPGGTLWGANAVNGVINIITKKAKDTQGALITYGGGSDYRDLGGIRYGDKIGENCYWRTYVKHLEHAPGYGSNDYDAWRQGRVGFRADWEADRSNTLTFQGDGYLGEEGFLNGLGSPTPPYDYDLLGHDELSGGNLLARWTHTYDDDSDWQLQTYYDRANRNHPTIWDQEVNTFDVEFQRRFPIGQRHEIIWGIDYRQVDDTETCEGFAINFIPAHRTTSLFGVFIQDQITLVEDKLFFTVGSKFEENDYTGFEYQPSARLLYAVDEKRSLWGAISRAVRTPSRLNHDAYVTSGPDPLPFPPFQYFPRIQGSRTFESEDLMAYEVGYRAQPNPAFSYDIALFYNVYEDLSALRLSDGYFDPFYPDDYIMPLLFVNGARAQTYGFEVVGQWSITKRWRISPSYSLLRIDYDLVDADQPSLWAKPDNNPRNQVRLISSWDLGDRWQLDTIFRYVDELHQLADTRATVPAYLTMDLRLAWMATKNCELAVIGRNLLDQAHPEFKESIHTTYSTEVERSVFGKVTWWY
jgi:iron complex outermembrane receptor protein